MRRFNAQWGLWVLLGIWSILSSPSFAADAPPLLEIKPGDRVALVGGAFFEREQRAGYIETVLTLSHPGVAFKLRNFAWSGDTVWGEARAGFDTAKEGYERLVARVAEFKPTLILVNYGMNESFKGEVGLGEFRAGLKRVLDDLAKDGARIALISPLPLENLGPPLPDPAEANRNIKLYAEAVADEATRRGAAYIDLASALPALRRSESPAPLTHDGVQFTEEGYRLVAEALGRVGGYLRAPSGTGFGQTLNFVCDATPQGERPRFHSRRTTLPAPPSPEAGSADESHRVITATGLAPGAHKLVVNGREVARADAGAWASGVRVASGPEFDRVEELRRSIIRKNELFFHRWRPQNDTYLFLFRKHEQGQNAVEIPQFDPLVDELDKKIADLSQPSFQTYEFIPVAEAAQ